MPQAVEDLEAIRGFVARDSPRYADLLVERLVTAVEILERVPQAGRSFLSTRARTFGSSCGHRIAWSTALSAIARTF
jgi:plasmid stabilization system protein ParE